LSLLLESVAGKGWILGEVDFDFESAEVITGRDERVENGTTLSESLSTGLSLESLNTIVTSAICGSGSLLIGVVTDDDLLI